MKNLTDLEMLRIACTGTGALDIIDTMDYSLACQIRQRLDSTKLVPKAVAESIDYIPESNESMVDRLPDPKKSQWTAEKMKRVRSQKYAHA
jgi:hypothetical protein